VDQQFVLTECEASKMNYAADTLGVSRHDLRIKVCQFKSFVANRTQDAMELKATMAQNIAEKCSNATSFMRLIYGLAGLVGLSFVTVTTGAVSLALLLISAFLVFQGAIEVMRLLKSAWKRFSADIDSTLD